MFDRFRKPIRKPQSYRLQLTPLEVRDVPATWHVEATSAAGYRNHFLMTSAIALLPLPERGGEKMDFSDAWKVMVYWRKKPCHMQSNRYTTNRKGFK